MFPLPLCLLHRSIYHVVCQHTKQLHESQIGRRVKIRTYQGQILPITSSIRGKGYFSLSVVTIAMMIFMTESDFDKYTEPTALWYFSKI